MPRVTALRDQRAGVAVDLDGASWRVLPLDAVVRAELRVGEELDRPRLRTLARELRVSRALAAATRRLNRGDRSRARLAGELADARIPADARDVALDALARAGVVDDERFATARASALAARGYGNAVVEWRLEREGVEPEAVARAVDALPSEAERAAAVVARRGRGIRTARLLVQRGFDSEVAEAAAGNDGESAVGWSG